MNDDEYADLLRYVEHRLRDLRDPGLSDRVVSAARGRDTVSARTQLLALLDALRSDVALGSTTTARAVLSRLRRVAGTDSGRPIDGLSVRLSDQDRRLFGVEEVDLVGGSALRDVLDALDRLSAAILEDAGEER